MSKYDLMQNLVVENCQMVKYSNRKILFYLSIEFLKLHLFVHVYNK